MQSEREQIRLLARAQIEDLLKTLAADPPPREEPRQNKRRWNWRKRWREWYAGRIRDIVFVSDPARSAKWFEAAGFDWQVMADELERRGLLEWPDESIIPDAAIEERKRGPKSGSSDV